MSRVLVCLALVLSSSIQQPSAPVRALVARAIAAMGGDAALKSLACLQIDAMGHEFFIDQSERPEGPFIVGYLQTTETRDVAKGRSRVERQQRNVQVPEWGGAGTATIVDADAAVLQRGDRAVPAGRQAFEDGRERIELAPERVLFAALEAGDLAAAPDVTVQGVVQHAVTFSWRGRQVRLLLNAGDNLPTALELVADDPSGIWGRVRETTYYSLWTLLPGGVRYPLQYDRDWNGVTRGSTTIMKIAVNQPIDEALFSIPADAKKAFVSLPSTYGIPSLTFNPARRADVAAGVAQYSGNWNVGVVEQPDGLVVIEAPIGSHYSAQVLDELSKRYPARNIKAVVTTSDAWPHLGGVREYAARRVPIYALDLNRPILERLLKADYSGHPDALAKQPKPARFTFVSAKTVIGTGATRIELYPVRGENGERMMAAYVPASKLLYTSDEIMRDRGGAFFMPEFLVEVRDLVQREHLDVERIFGMHIGPTPWTEIEAAIHKS
jgi:glyoxylase-like metal-dependent hydrolase (beta-lactamase superfamily II)